MENDCLILPVFWWSYLHCSSYHILTYSVLKCHSDYNIAFAKIINHHLFSKCNSCFYTLLQVTSFAIFQTIHHLWLLEFCFSLVFILTGYNFTSDQCFFTLNSKYDTCKHHSYFWTFDKSVSYILLCVLFFLPAIADLCFLPSYQIFI